MKPTLQQRNAESKGKPCVVPGCEHLRTSVSPYCCHHRRAANYYGSPYGHAIRRNEYLKELQEVTELLQSNPDHPGLTAVLRWLNEWLALASTGEAPCGNGVFKHIHDKQVPAFDLLAEICAVWLFAHRNPNRLPDDQRLTYALSRYLVRLAGYEQRVCNGRTVLREPSIMDVRESGNRIRSTLALFLINIVESLKRKAEQANDFKSSLSIPLQ